MKEQQDQVFHVHQQTRRMRQLMWKDVLLSESRNTT